jgi:hypothetical protein
METLVKRTEKNGLLNKVIAITTIATIIVIIIVYYHRRTSIFVPSPLVDEGFQQVVDQKTSGGNYILTVIVDGQPHIVKTSVLPLINSAGKVHLDSLPAHDGSKVYVIHKEDAQR